MIGADGALYAIRRELFVAPPADTILDDMAIPMGVIRSGKRVVFETAARAHEQGSETAQEEFSRKTRVIAGAMQFMGRHDSTVPLAIAAGHPVARLAQGAALAVARVRGVRVCRARIALAGESIGYAVAVGGQVSLLGLGLAGCAPRAPPRRHHRARALLLPGAGGRRRRASCAA